MIEVAEIVVDEADEPDVLADLFDPHLLAGEHLTKIHLAAVETDPAAVGDHRGPVVERIVEFTQSLIGARGPGPEDSQDKPQAIDEKGVPFPREG